MSRMGGPGRTVLAMLIDVALALKQCAPSAELLRVPVYKAICVCVM